MTIGIRAERRKKRAQRRLPALVGKKELSHVAGHDGEIRVRRAQPAGIDAERVAGNDFEPARISSPNLGQGRQASLVALDRDHVGRAMGQEGSRQPPRPRADFNRRAGGKLAGGARDASGEI